MQILRLNMNYPDNLLEIEEERKMNASDFKNVADVAVWRLQTIHRCLLTKPYGTFWIKIDSPLGEKGQEQFKFNNIEHARNPVVPQFDILLAQCMITDDLLLGRPKFDSISGKSKNSSDAVSFKIKKNAEGLLFLRSKLYFF